MRAAVVIAFLAALLFGAAIIFSSQPAARTAPPAAPVTVPFSPSFGQDPTPAWVRDLFAPKVVPA